MPPDAQLVIEPWHGKVSGYNKRGCRCDDCTEAVRKQRRAQRHNGPRPEPDPNADHTYAGPIWRCPYCLVWIERTGSELDPPACHYCSNGVPVVMSALTRTPPTPSPAFGTWAEDL